MNDAPHSSSLSNATGSAAATPADRPAGTTATGAKKLWPWLALAAILLVYIGAIALLRPAANFGAIQDDAMYFASAKAIASGQGYLLPSFPGGATAAKYPEFYPWLLSWIWRVDPNFPANVTLAIGLTVVFGCWFLVAGFLVARRTLGLGDGWALFATGLCAFNFFALLVSGSVLSDLPFAAMALTAALAADRALERRAHWWWMVAAGALAGLSVGMRTLGVAVLGGIAVVALGRRAWKQAAIFCCVAGPVALPWLWPVFRHLFASFGGAVHARAPASQGWQQTLAFYTSYIGQWREFVPNWAAQRAVCVKNFLNLVEEPGSYLFLPLSDGVAWLSVVGGSLVSLGAWAGIFSRARRGGWRSLFVIFPLYAAIVIPWPFPLHRFLVPFQPLLFGGLAVSLTGLGRSVIGAFRGAAPAAERAIAAAMALIVIGLGGVAAANYASAVPRSMAHLMAGQRALLAEKRQAYGWIRAHAAPKAPFIAYDDVLLYLYTGRQAIRPIACSTTSFYTDDPAAVERDAAHLADVARHVDAGYWMVTVEDYGVELGRDKAVLGRRQDQLVGPLPVVFRSTDGRVVIYDLRCFQQPGSRGCPAPRAGQSPSS
jgi:4-amino-4-deoxy-L-arabinose transferase-like glycosyltransferase